MKKYFIISGLLLQDTNRGTAALGYGAFSFLKEKNFIKPGQILLNLKFRKFPWLFSDHETDIEVQGVRYKQRTIYLSSIQKKILMKTGAALPFTKLSRVLSQIDFVAAINGGDGFSDIYNTKTFFSRLGDTLLAQKANIPVIELPQTFGPFEHVFNYHLAETILQKAAKVYVRDGKFISELNKMGVEYELTKDLSAFMQPEPWDIDIKPGSIGINVSGLCYSNQFRTLSGQFGQYPELINRIILHFQHMKKTIYLIPHSYCYGNPEENNDDMVACKLAFERLDNKANVFLIKKDLTSPQVKYVISKMLFFCGTRMHANFAAIYTGVPVFGLAYSYKFSGAFYANGLDGEKQTAMINNIKANDIDSIIQKIDAYYKEAVLF